MRCKSEVREKFSSCGDCATGGEKGDVEPCRLLPALGCKSGRVMVELEYEGGEDLGP